MSGTRNCGEDDLGTVEKMKNSETLLSEWAQEFQ